MPLPGPSAKSEELVRGEYFVIRRHHASEPFSIATEHRFRVLICLDGSVAVEAGEGRIELRGGQTLLLPAGCESATITPAGPATLLETFCP
jgi:mannose-6-phosphate isomerase class I